MSVLRYKLTSIGWLGAALFVLPTPITAWLTAPRSLSPGEIQFQKALEAAGGAPQLQLPSTLSLTVLATATLIGLVLLLIGREIHSD